MGDERKREKEREIMKWMWLLSLGVAIGLAGVLSSTQEVLLQKGGVYILVALMNSVLIGLGCGYLHGQAWKLWCSI